jgi:hypothetical protein
MLEVVDASPVLGMLESAELLILGDVDPVATPPPPPPRIVFTSCDMGTAVATNKREMDEAPLSLGVVALLRPPEGLGILDGGTCDLDVVDMYMGGRIVGTGLALGGSIAESV